MCVVPDTSVPIQPSVSHLALGLSVGTSALIAALLLAVSGVMISKLQSHSLQFICIALISTDKAVYRNLLEVTMTKKNLLRQNGESILFSVHCIVGLYTLYLKKVKYYVYTRAVLDNCKSPEKPGEIIHCGRKENNKCK